MFNKFFKFLRGYVIIQIYGKNCARFINICLRRSIGLWGALPIEGGIEAAIPVSDFNRIRSVASKCKVKVRIKEKHGMRHTIRKYRKRYVFLIAFMLCVLLCAVMTQFVWLVEINGVQNSDINQIIETLDEMGIKSGAYKGTLPKPMEVKQALISSNEHVAWAWVYIEGAKARVEIYEQSIPPAVIDKKIACDTVAACDGVIRKMTVQSGFENVRVGDAVNAGDVIVSGKVPVFTEGSPEEYIFVHSMAEIEAYTFHEKTGEYELYYESRTPTGKHKTNVSFELMGKNIPVIGHKIDYEEYTGSEKRHEMYIPFFGYTGISVNTTRFDEVTVNREPLAIETAVEFAKNDLEAKIAKELTPGSRLIDENIEYTKTDNETINVTLEMNFIQNIAAQQPINADLK